jgi:hypothetical protein
MNTKSTIYSIKELISTGSYAELQLGITIDDFSRLLKSENHYLYDEKNRFVNFRYMIINNNEYYLFDENRKLIYIEIYFNYTFSKRDSLFRDYETLSHLSLKDWDCIFYNNKYQIIQGNIGLTKSGYLELTAIPKEQGLQIIELCIGNRKDCISILRFHYYQKSPFDIWQKKYKYD